MNYDYYTEMSHNKRTAKSTEYLKPLSCTFSRGTCYLAAAVQLLYSCQSWVKKFCDYPNQRNPVAFRLQQFFQDQCSWEVIKIY